MELPITTTTGGKREGHCEPVGRAIVAVPADGRLSNPGPDPEKLALGAEVDWEGREGGLGEPW